MSGIQKKIQTQYPFMPPALARQLVSVLQNNNDLYQQGTISLRMTRLLQFLRASDNPAHKKIARHLYKKNTNTNIDKGLAISQVVLGPQRVRYMTPTQVASIKTTSKDISKRRPTAGTLPP